MEIGLQECADEEDRGNIEKSQQDGHGAASRASTVPSFCLGLNLSIIISSIISSNRNRFGFSVLGHSYGEGRMSKAVALLYPLAYALAVYYRIEISDWLTSTTLADLFTPLLRVDPGSAVRTSPRA
jgi:hypothetical protein